MRIPKTRASWVGILSGLMLALPVLTACSSEPSSLPPVATQASDLPMAEATPPPTAGMAVAPDTPDPRSRQSRQRSLQCRLLRLRTHPSPSDPDIRLELREAAFGYLRELAEGLGPRESSTAEEKAAADFLMATFTELGYSPSLQEFEETSLEASLMVDTPAGWGRMRLGARPLTGSAPGTVSGAVEFVGLAREEDIPAEGLDGKIALIKRGEITFGTKVERVSVMPARQRRLSSTTSPAGFRVGWEEGLESLQ